ncbi:hypothetical protein ACFL4G_07525 [Thermodesulfobacteriota bacterium]
MIKNSPSRRGTDRQEIPTSLEIPIIREGKILGIDLKDLPIIFGLSILSNDICHKIISRHDLDRVDIEIEKKVKRAETPQLAALRIENIKVTGDYAVFEKILGDEGAFQEDMTAIFGTFQMQRWRKHIYPQDPDTLSKALVFPRTRRLDTGNYNFRIILERLQSSKKVDKFFLRATVEGLEGRHLDLSSFPHVVVENPEGRTFIAGSTRISQMLCDQVRWEAKRGKQSYSEINRTESYIFNRLGHSGLDRLVSIEIGWVESYIELFRAMEPDQLRGMYKKILLLLEDHTVRGLLDAGETIRVGLGETFANLDLSQLGRSLNVSFGKRRRISSLNKYLRRMPALEEYVSSIQDSAPLEGVKVLLIHHITAEVLAFIASLRALGAEDVSTLFVHYGEEIPRGFFEAILDLDQNRFRCYSLNNIEESLSVEGYFVLSPRFSALKGLDELDKRLHGEKPGYMNAMTRTATHIFFDTLLRAIREKARCLIVEDGGYITPLITERALAGTRFIDILNENGIPLSGEIAGIAGRPLREILDHYLVGTVEHTKNGLDRLSEVVKRRGGLARPAFSIAVSDLKITEEAEEVSASILSAIESVLHARGKVLSTRKAVVIGSEGSIGKNLVSHIRARRLREDRLPVLEVDLRRPADLGDEGNETFASRFQDLPRERAMEIDLVIGVTGRPAFQWEDMEMLLVEGRASSYYLVSGSTKTVEFENVSQGLERLLRVRNPAIRGFRCSIEGEEIDDPQTGRTLGHKYCFTFDGQSPLPGGPQTKEIHFLASLMPINFLYYGVPGEVMDPVLCQLLRCAVGLVDRTDDATPPASTLHAVDRDIDEDGKPIQCRSGDSQEP